MPRLIRRPYRWLLGAGLVAALLLAAGYAIGGAAIEASRLPGHDLVSWHLIAPRIGVTLTAAFFFVVGGCVGSFLNVLVWRWPRGQSLGGHSHCPRCRTRLATCDNVPMAGWLWLGGRCRTCRLPISPRYPVVELALAICFAAAGTTSAMGWNLPHPPPLSPWDHRSVGPGTAAAGILIYHLASISLLWAAVLMRWDGFNLPRKWMTAAAVVVLGGLLAWPPAVVVPWRMAVPDGWPPAVWSRSGVIGPGERLVHVAVRILTALATAGFIARVLARTLCPAADMKLDPLGRSTRRLIDATALVAVASVVAGWQASLAIVPVAALVAWALGSARPDIDPLARLGVGLAIVLTIHIAFWDGLASTGIWPSERSGPAIVFGWFVAVLLAPALLSKPSRAAAATDLQPELS